MKKYLLVSLVALLSAVGVSAETYYEVNTSPDPHRQEYRPGQVIVKFKTDSPVKIRKAPVQGDVVSGVNNIDLLLQELGVVEAEPLMPLTGAQKMPRRLKAYNGQDIKVHDLSKLFLLQVVDAGADIHSIAGRLSELPEVEFAEPNYLVYAQGIDSKSVDDPLHSQQWGIKAVNVDKLWDAPPVTDKRPLIAILDTGVDIWHPDLQKNIWTNGAELTGSEGYDDDGNGFKDDIHGWDFVNQTDTIDDYNGHGTHCAGIAAACGGNGIGIVGANPDALIMPVTVLQSDGVGDIGTVIKALDYAAANGADVISMSFGGYSHSIAQEQALARAYSKAVLVAAAGNDELSLCPHQSPMWGQMFPAAFTFVLGVQATTPEGELALFSNKDVDGPVYFCPVCFSEEQMYNYELRAPGVDMMSTYPGGCYKALNGTSMACPLVAGALSRLISAKDYPTKELLFGDLIHTAKDNVDFMTAYNIKDEDRKPSLLLVGWRIDDESDQDGRFDAGEMINFYPIIRNEWGTAKNIKVWMELGELEGKVVSFEQTLADFNKPLSSYAKAESDQPIRFRIAGDVVDGRHIRLLLHAQCDGMDAPVTTEVTVIAENGVEISGMIEHDMTLEPGVSYIVTNTMAIPDGVTLTILPGAVLKFGNDAGLNIATGAKVIADGTPENPIIFTSRDHEYFHKVTLSNLNLKYTKISNLTGELTKSRLIDCEVSKSHYLKLSGLHISRSNIMDNKGPGDIATTLFNSVNCTNIINNHSDSQDCYLLLSESYSHGCNIYSNINRDGICNLSTRRLSGNDKVEVIKFDFPSYLGSAVETKVREGVRDIESGYGFRKFDLSNMLLQPNLLAHGVVWKVIVDGYDAQDEFTELPPLGVGRHKFEVWYSKRVDESQQPTLTMGVRPPYNQTAIAEKGSWRTEIVPFSPFENSKGLVNVEDGTCNNEYYWTVDGGILSSSLLRGDWPGFKEKYMCSYSPKAGVTNKLYQRLEGIAQNGRYKLQISAKVDRLADTPGVQYVYMNDTKVDLDENALNGAIYEVIADVHDNTIEVGIAQTEPISDHMYIDNVSLTMLEEYSNERMEPVSVYTAYITLKGKENIDGLNRIAVSACTDTEHFDIPIENMRFNVEVAAAGSMSTGFMATPGIRKVDLEWEQQDDNVDDILGYNLYRMNEREVADRNGDISIVTDTIRVNERLLDGTAYTDFDVVPGKRYDYYYKIMRTSMDENSPSRVVSVVPLTAQKGDANGSLNVDVADVVTEVSYITGGNPQPFIYDAADVNEDAEIDVLDIVGTVRLILYPEASSVASEGVAKYWIRDNILWFENDVALGGVQFTLKGDPATATFTPLDGLDGMEVSGAWRDDAYTILAYSMNGHAITPGVHPMLSLGSVADVMKVTASDPMGHDVVTLRSDVSGMAVIDIAQMQVPTPNPFVDEVTIPYVIGDNGNHSVEIVITDLAGVCVESCAVEGGYGKHFFRWRHASGKGIYFATLYIDGCTVQTAKLIKK